MDTKNAAERRNSRISEEERSLIRDHFRGNESLLKAVRKIMLPQFDVDAPIGAQVDPWLSIDVDGLPDIVITEVKAMKRALATIEGGLLTLKAVADTPTDEEKAKEIQKNAAADSTM